MLDDHRSSASLPAERVAEGAAVACVAAAPLLLAAVDPTVSAALSIVGCASLLVTCLVNGTRSLLVSRGGLALAALAVVPLLQIVPVPEALHLGLGRDLYGTLGGPQGWTATSLDPPATWRELVRWLGWTATFLLLQHRATASSSARARLLVAIAISALLVLTIGLCHELLHARALFGWRAFEVSAPLVTTFGNQNHLASFLVLGASVCLGLALSATEPRGSAAWAVAAIGLAGGTILTGSRGGLLALGAAAVVFTTMGLLAGPRLRPVPSRPVLAAAFALVVVVVLGALHLRPQLVREIVDAATSGPSLGGRLPVFAAAWRMALAHWPIGAGLGAFETAHTYYLPAPSTVRFTHVESEPLHVAAELGMPGALAFTIICGILGWNLLQRARRSWPEAGALAGVAGVGVQNLFDFGLHFASGLVALALLASAAPSPLRSRRVRLVPAIALALAAIVFGAWRAAPSLEEETRALLATDEAHRKEPALRMAARHPADYHPFQVVAVGLLEKPGGAGASLRWLNKALYLNPRSGELHLLTGVALARVGRASQAADEFRTATLAGVRSIEHAALHLEDEELLARSVPRERDATVVAAEYLGYELRRWKPALALLRRALDDFPDDERALGTLGNMLVAAGDPQAAVDVLRERRAELRSPGLALIEARALRSCGRHDEAVALLEAAQRWNVDPLRLELARMRIDAGRLAEAGALLDAVSDPSPLMRSDVAVVRAAICRQQRNRDCVRDELRRAIRLTPQRSWIRVELAELYLELGRLAEAQHEIAGLGGEADHLRAQIERAVRNRSQLGGGLRP